MKELFNRRRPRRIFVNTFQLKLATASVVSLCAGSATTAVLSLDTAKWAVFALLLAATALAFLFLSHRVAGPLVRFQNVFSALRRCDLSDRVHLRDSDWLHDEADDLNAAVRHLRRRIAVLRGRHLAAEVALGKVRIALKFGNPSDLARALREVDRAHGRVTKNLARFTLRRSSKRHPNPPVSVDEAWWQSKAGLASVDLIAAVALFSTLAPILVVLAHFCG